MKYATKTVRITPKGGDITTLQDVLDKEIEYIYSINKEEDIMSLTITPFIKETFETYEGKTYKIDIPYMYYIIYVYRYEEQ